VLAIAHRTPATRARCTALAAAGATVFEIDVQAIGEDLVVSHYLPVSPALPRLRRDRLSFTWRRRGRLEVALAEAVDALPAEAEILLDLKTDGGPRAAELVERVISGGPDPARCYASTKGWDTLPALAAAGFRTWRTIGDAGALASVLAMEVVPDHAVTVRHRLLTAPTLAALRERVPLVMTWTVNDVGRARALIELGVDGITTDSGDVLRVVADAG
jgi:hypothetical protein